MELEVLLLVCVAVLVVAREDGTNRESPPDHHLNEVPDSSSTSHVESTSSANTTGNTTKLHKTVKLLESQKLDESTSGHESALTLNSKGKAPTENSTVETPTKNSTGETPTKNSTVETPTKNSTGETPTKNSTVETPTKNSTGETPTKNSTVETPTKNSTVETPTENPTIKTSSENSTGETPTKNSAVETPTENPTIKTSSENSTIQNSTGNSAINVPTKNSAVEIPTGNATLKTSEFLVPKKETSPMVGGKSPQHNAAADNGTSLSLHSREEQSADGTSQVETFKSKKSNTSMSKDQDSGRYAPSHPYHSANNPTDQVSNSSQGMNQTSSSNVTGIGKMEKQGTATLNVTELRKRMNATEVAFGILNTIIFNAVRHRFHSIYDPRYLKFLKVIDKRLLQHWPFHSNSIPKIPKPTRERHKEDRQESKEYNEIGESHREPRHTRNKFSEVVRNLKSHKSLDKEPHQDEPIGQDKAQETKSVELEEASNESKDDEDEDENDENAEVQARKYYEINFGSATSTDHTGSKLRRRYTTRLRNSAPL